MSTNTNEYPKEKFGLQKLAERFRMIDRSLVIEELIDLGSENPVISQYREGISDYKEAAEGLGWERFSHDDLQSEYVFICDRGSKHPSSVELLEQLGWTSTTEVSDIETFTFAKGDVVKSYEETDEIRCDFHAGAILLQELGLPVPKQVVVIGEWGPTADSEEEAWEMLCDSECIKTDAETASSYLEVSHELGEFISNLGAHVREVFGMRIWARFTANSSPILDYYIEEAAKHFFADEWNGKDY